MARPHKYLPFQEARAHQDNEQWHLLIIQELTQKLGIKEGWLKFIIIPQILAFTYYYISWLLYVIKPKLSYQLNAEFEDHAEHEYMNFAKDPQWSQSGYSGGFSKDYGTFETLKDLWIQIGLDERTHKQDSLSKLDSPRFGIRGNN